MFYSRPSNISRKSDTWTMNLHYAAYIGNDLAAPLVEFNPSPYEVIFYNAVNDPTHRRRTRRLFPHRRSPHRSSKRRKGKDPNAPGPEYLQASVTTIIPSNTNIPNHTEEIVVVGQNMDKVERIMFGSHYQAEIIRAAVTEYVKVKVPTLIELLSERKATGDPSLCNTVWLGNLLQGRKDHYSVSVNAFDANGTEIPSAQTFTFHFTPEYLHSVISALRVPRVNQQAGKVRGRRMYGL
eukprot:TRINITY_DN2882_c0_g1_i1.p1 TRINITY_DN2882_c0_g1~~TRINITY_DN2882_c0_g1_i1.p1  ORF type:complete len:238 (-),score=11.43 TRINITY_DN2882_c0_g1_i1:34-747(-)